ncbi:MAG: hypothetical protein HKN44_07910 [Ilumatobacter sp.]|nr:hypothetical protein [Ilumatobacter sp.]
MELFRPVHVVRQDAEIATALRDGDTAAVGALYAGHGAVLYSVAAVAAGDPARAAELTQRVVVQAWRDAGDIEPGDDFAPWLASITRRFVDADGGAAPAPDVDLVWAVRVAVDSLDADRREMLRLSRLEGVDRTAIADLGDTDPDDVRAQLERAERRVASVASPSVPSVAAEVVPALLSDPMFWLDPPPDLSDRINVAVAADVGARPPSIGDTRSSSQSSWVRPALLGALAAITLVFGGVVVLSALSGTTERDAVTAELTPTGLVLDVSGDVSITSFDAGLEVVLDAPNLPRGIDGTFYQAWVGTTDGALVPVGTFRRGGRITMWAGVELDRVASFVVTLESAVPGDDGGQSSSGDVVLRAAFG